MSNRGTIGAIVYDLRASGVVRNLLRIARAARGAGLDFELWPLRGQGEFLQEAQDCAPLAPILGEQTTAQRDWDSLRHQRALADAIKVRAPALLFSAGNQMHWHVAKALLSLPDDKRPRALARASNAVVSLGRSNWLIRKALARQEAFQYRTMNHVVAVSGELRDQIEKGLGIDPAKLSVIPNGIDAQRFISPIRQAPSNDRPIILGIGRLSKQKDFITLIDALALLNTQPKPVLRIFGRGSEAWMNRLRARAHAKGVSDQVELLGHVDTVADHLQTADLFVSSSRWEGASNVVLEALAGGTPIVATKAPTGIAEVLAPLGEENLVPVGDAPALAQAMERRLALPRGSEALIQRARDFDLQRTLDAYITLLEQQLSSTPSG
ncbi:glycosyltransferase [Erythrobacter sp. SCSIO 43205]|uniref:glycosyltransferase n=1 Tax=Erythrobacter sp. SCSIO 43205 TaxID=2779361 RepID=UPI001CA937A1|nr:glycosyltransferase [Erythrobacter sp. SCSIO 43205]UAB77722.1 glycosyltransferase [Erythrobacter sp. SCSIO 43205]